MGKDRCVSDTELPAREILIKAAYKALHFCCLWSFLWANCSRAVIKIAHLTHGLRTLGQLYRLSGSSCCLCLEIEIIFQNFSLCVSTFLSESSDAEDSCKASINKMLPREIAEVVEIVENRAMQQVQQSMTEGPVCEVDEVYDTMEDRSKKAVKTGCGQGQAV